MDLLEVLAIYVASVFGFSLIFSVPWFWIAIPLGILFLWMYFDDKAEKGNSEKKPAKETSISNSGVIRMQSGLNKNNPLDVCYAFGVLATQVGPYDISYVQAKIDLDSVFVQVILDEGTCKYKGAKNLNNSQDLIKLDVPKDVANFISSLNATFKESSVLEVTISNLTRVPTLREVEESIVRSQRTARLPVKYRTAVAKNGVISIDVSYKH